MSPISGGATSTLSPQNIPSAVSSALVGDVSPNVESIEMKRLFNALERGDVSNRVIVDAFSNNPSFRQHLDSFNGYVLSTRGMAVYKNTDPKVWN